jgi:hypothetical protein
VHSKRRVEHFHQLQRISRRQCSKKLFHQGPLLYEFAWRDAPYFTEVERGALALAEAATRIADRPDEVWDEAARHFSEREPAALTLSVALTNVWNRFNITTRQVAGEWVKSTEAKEWMEKQAEAQ